MVEAFLLVETYHVAKDESPSPPVPKSEHERLHLANRFSLTPHSNAVPLKSGDGDGSLTIRQVLGVCWKVEKQERGDNGPTDGGHPLDDEEPPPSPDPVSALEATGYGAGEEAAKGPGEDGCRHEDGEPLRLFAPLVPR